MAFIRYEEAPVNVGYGSASNLLYANNVTVGESLPLTPIRSLGYNGAVAIAPSGPVEGSWSVSYTLFSETARPICTNTDAAQNVGDWQNPALATFILNKGYDPADAITMSIGDSAVELFKKGLATSFSISAEPNSTISATANGNFYDCSIIVAADGILSDTPIDGKSSFDPAFGSSVTMADKSAGFSCKPFSASYEYTRGASPVYTLGAVEAAFVSITDPQESMTFQGSNLPFSVAADPESETCGYCTDGRTLQFVVKSLCGNAVADYTVCGMVTSRDIEVAVDDILRGNITVVNYSVVQQLQSVTCD